LESIQNDNAPPDVALIIFPALSVHASTSVGVNVLHSVPPPLLGLH